MFASARSLARVACAMVLSACADSTDPTAPRAESPNDVPALSLEGSGPAPTPEELAEMPSEFATEPSINVYSTDVGFSSQEGRAFAHGYMSYLASDASQDVTLDLRFENDPIGSSNAYGEQSNWLPWVRTLATTAYIGVSGDCGHLADGRTNHKAWHKFLVGGWKFMSWGNEARSSADSREQPACPPPPPPPTGTPGGGGDDEYDTGCEFCQEWLYFMDGELVDIWWECQPIDDGYCDGLMR